MNKLNQTFEFDENSLIHLDTKTKGWKNLSKMLDKRGVKWTNDKDPTATHIVCTRFVCNEFYPRSEYILNPLWESTATDKHKKRYRDVQIKHIRLLSSEIRGCYCINFGLHLDEKIISNGISKFIEAAPWEVYRGSKIYSYKNFKNILENENRTEIDQADKDKITNLLKSGDEANVELALILIKDYTLQEEWIPWLHLNTSIKSVRKFFKLNGIDYSPHDRGLKDRVKGIKYSIYNHINYLSTDKTNKDELIQEILRM